MGMGMGMDVVMDVNIVKLTMPCPDKLNSDLDNYFSLGGLKVRYKSSSNFFGRASKYMTSAPKYRELRPRVPGLPSVWARPPAHDIDDLTSTLYINYVLTSALIQCHGINCAAMALQL